MRSILSILICVLLLAPPARAGTLKRESKDECCICHVLWFDSLAKRKKTLLERIDSPIVIAGSAGLSSSKEICYSCHDGYVADSRNAISKNNKHHLIGKVPDGLKLPDIFRLTKDNEFYCGTCHGFHDVRARGEVGQTPFTRLDNDRSQMCTACHADKLDKHRRYAGHPVLVKAGRLAIAAVRRQGLKFGPEGEILCQSCHNSHGRRAMIAPVEDSSICRICHGNEMTLFGTEHDLRVTLPHEKNIKKEPLSKSGPCGACHTPHAPTGPKLWAREFKPGGALSQLCLACHNKNPADGIKDTGRFSHPVDVDQPSHLNRPAPERVAAGRLPLSPKKGGAALAGTVQCFSCHNPHRWDPNNPGARGGKKIDGDATTSFLRISNAGDSALCTECHTDKKQLLSYDHNLRLTAPDAKNIQGLAAVETGPCEVCHIPHNAGAPKLWARTVSKDEALLPQYCLECHHPDGPAKKKMIGKNDHPVDVVSKGLHIPPSDRVAAVLPLFSQEGGIAYGDRIGCLTCHDPHIWSSQPMASGVETDADAGTVQDPHNNVEGDATSSFLRKPASPAPDLCIVCHEETSLLVGTDHDLFVTAPTVKNLKGQTAMESGRCGVCHAMHNSPNKLMLWARGFGPVDDGQHPINALCTSCHSKGAAAENKIPPVATHPAGVLINNVFRSNKERRDYIPIFDRHGKEAAVGDLSCPSCHSFYMWDRRRREKGPQENIEGNAETSFLRASTQNLVCIDCHGEEAIWRYTYFHSIQKRKLLKRSQPGRPGPAGSGVADKLP